MSDRASREAEQQRYLDGVEGVRARLMALPNVVEVGVGLKETGGQLTDEIVIHVLVSEKVPSTKLAPDQVVPAEIHGLRTDVIRYREAVPIIGFSDEDDWKNYSPKVGGSRIGNDALTGTGTLGCFATAADSSTVFLSNHHVLFDGNVAVGSEVGQPQYSASCCCTCNKIGAVVDGDKTLDCAIAKLDSDVPFVPKVRKIKKSDGTVELDGFISGSSAPLLNEEVWKVGARTGLTRGTLSAVSPTVQITPKAPFTKIANHGDSGSVVVELSTGNVVALLFAIDKEGGSLGLANSIIPILARLNITILVTDQTKQYDVLQTDDTGADGLTRAAGDMGVSDLIDRIRSSAVGEKLLAIFETYQRECFNLVNTCRPVTVTWHRNQGPTFLAALLRSAKIPEYELPEEVNGISRLGAVEAMRDAFVAHGSPELRAYLNDDPDQLSVMLGGCRTVEEMICGYEAASVPAPSPS